MFHCVDRRHPGHFAISWIRFLVVPINSQGQDGLLRKQSLLQRPEYSSTTSLRLPKRYFSHSSPSSHSVSTLRLEVHMHMSRKYLLMSNDFIESRRYMRNMKIQPNTLLPEQFGGGYISSYQFYNQFHGGFCAPYICNPNYMLIVDFRYTNTGCPNKFGIYYYIIPFYWVYL